MICFIKPKIAITPNATNIDPIIYEIVIIVASDCTINSIAKAIRAIELIIDDFVNFDKILL